MHGSVRPQQLASAPAELSGGSRCAPFTSSTPPYLYRHRRNLLGVPFQKRWFFVQGGILCYMDPEAGKADNAIVCGQITASDISSRLKYELSIFAGGRHYFLRVDTIAELENWHAVCNRIGREWLQQSS